MDVFWCLIQDRDQTREGSDHWGAVFSLLVKKEVWQALIYFLENLKKRHFLYQGVLSLADW